LQDAFAFEAETSANAESDDSIPTWSD